MNAPNEMDMDLRARTVALERQTTDHHGRLTELEKWQRKSEVDDARTDVRYDEMNKKLNRIETIIARLNWMVISGLVMGLVGFLLKGGINLP